MARHRWSDVTRTRLSDAQIEENRRWAENEVIELNLRAMRELLGKTQVEVAEATGMAQSELSKAERRPDHLVSTLKRYVEALGGELEVTARFGKKRVKLSGV